MTDLSTNNSKGLLPQISIGSVVVSFLLQVSGFRRAIADRGHLGPEPILNEGPVAFGHSRAAFAAGFGKASPDVGGGEGQTTSGGNEGHWGVAVLMGKMS